MLTFTQSDQNRPASRWGQAACAQMRCILKHPPETAPPSTTTVAASRPSTTAVAASRRDYLLHTDITPDIPVSNPPRRPMPESLAIVSSVLVPASVSPSVSIDRTHDKPVSFPLSHPRNLHEPQTSLSPPPCLPHACCSDPRGNPISSSSLRAFCASSGLQASGVMNSIWYTHRAGSCRERGGARRSR